MVGHSGDDLVAGVVQGGGRRVRVAPVARAVGASEREQALIDALASRYAEVPPADRAA